MFPILLYLCSHFNCSVVPNFTVFLFPGNNKGELAEDLREVFRTGDKSYTPELSWAAWQSLCDKWGQSYRSIKKMRDDPTYRYYFTYLNYHHRIQAMIYTTNWIERLQRDFRRVLRMRSAMPNEESVIVLMAKTAMAKTAYRRELPGIDRDNTLFPEETRRDVLGLLNN